MSVPRLGVVIVTFNATDVIVDCLESLLSAVGVHLIIVIVDNGSTDGTLSLVKAWAAGDNRDALSADIPFILSPVPKPILLSLPATPQPPADAGHRIVVIDTGVNAGFAAGVNHGLAYLAAQDGIDRFWVLNPDSVVPSATPRAFATTPVSDNRFSLMGGRVLYLDTPDVIQIDGGTIDWRTGVTGNVHLGASHAATPPPDPRTFDFITGASVVASRAFYDRVGPMREDYFLYYEEVDWAMKRGDLPLAYCAEAIVYHRAGTAIGSPTLGRPASALSLYFKYRARLRFMRRFMRRGLPGAYAYSLAKAGQLLIKGYPKEAWVILAASLNGRAPKSVREKLSDAAAQIAFQPTSRSD
jgi:GT2 family glycosyltransferase